MFLKSAIALVLAVPLFAADSGLTVHEWGTFTSVAGEDGTSQPWVSIAPPADLPCFVYHLDSCAKCGLARLRMETPVIYFYSPTPAIASVHVTLRTGLISEWYPQAEHVSQNDIGWPSVQVSPGAMAELPDAGDSSHYYAARATDADLLRVGDQFEKVLFYRGIADFQVDLLPKFLPDGKLEIRSISPDPVAVAILFENRSGRIGYRVLRNLQRGNTPMDPPDLTSQVDSIHSELAADLTAAGLYPKEAAAMIETWRDSWFEDGMRIFYLVPRKVIDRELPIKISPVPAAVERVFVGRIEVLSPAIKQALESALATGDVKTLARYGRFAQPFCDRIIQGPSRVRISQAASTFLSEAGMPPSPKAPCGPNRTVLPTEQR